MRPSTSSMAAEPIVIRGACPHDCPDTCAWEVTVERRRGRELVGVKDHPFTRGGLCAKVNHFLERVYSPDRLLHPLMRTGPKGEGAFERSRGTTRSSTSPSASGAIVAEHGGEAVLPYSLLGHPGAGAGRARWTGASSRSSAPAAWSGRSAVRPRRPGTSRPRARRSGCAPTTSLHSRFIVLWGTNTIVTNLHLWPFVQEARKAGARVVVIDPLRTRTAAAADWHVRPLPGTDAALALGLMHVIVAEGLHDADYVAAHTRGLRAPRGRARRSGRPSASRAGHGRPGRRGGRARARLRHDAPAGDPPADRHRAPSRGRADGAHDRLPAGARRRVARARRRDPRPDRVGRLTARSTRTRWPGSQPDTRARQHGAPRARAHRRSTRPSTRSWSTTRTRPRRRPTARASCEGLARDDLFTVVLEHFLTDTARYADVVLPATTQVEHVDLVPSWGHTYVTYNDPAIAPRRRGAAQHARSSAASRARWASTPSVRRDRRGARAGGARGRPGAAGHHRLRAPARGGVGRGRSARGLQAVRPGRLRDAVGAPAPVVRRPSARVRPATGRRGAAGAHDRQERAPLPQLDLRQPAAPPRRRGRAAARDAPRRRCAARDRRRRRRPRRNARGEVRRGRGSASVVRPGVVALPSGWWASRSPGGTMANALTTDELTDRGGGGAFHSARVEVEPAARTGRRGHQPGNPSSGGPMSRSRLFKLALPAVVALGAGTAVAIAAIPSASGVITACLVTTGTTPGHCGSSTRRRPRLRPAAPTRRRSPGTEQGPPGPAGRPRPARRPGSGTGTDTSGGGGSAAAAPPFDTSQTGGPSADIFLAHRRDPGRQRRRPAPEPDLDRVLRLPGQAADLAPPAPRALRAAAGQGLRRVLAQDLRRRRRAGATSRARP